MPKINLGRVKGDPLHYEDLTEEQKLELKGETGNTPIIKAGTTTIVNFDQAAKVTSETNGDVTSFNFQIPVGQEPPFYGAYDTFPILGDLNRTYIDDTVDPRLMYTWDNEKQMYVLTGGAGGADGSSIDIPITLLADAWTGDTAPYSQTITVPQMREGMTPLFYLSSTGADAEYAYSLITGYTTAYADITFRAADLPAVDITITLKGIPAQELNYVDNTIVVIAEPSAFAVSADPDYDGRYVATIPVEGMQAGAGGVWDIVRSGPVLSEEESKIALSITDVERLDGAVRIVTLEAPGQRFLMSIQGTYAGAGGGDIILAGMQEWFDRVEALEEEQKNNILKYVDGENIAEVTITEDNYAQLPSAPSGISPVFITAAYFGSCTGCFNIMSIGDGRCYAVGDAGTSITSLTIRYWYREKGY